MPDTKIFIDTDEEITFIIEKIKYASTQNVVVIVPDRASIFVTSASLKLLKKSIDRLDKKVIIVTMDEVGKKMADGMGIITAGRVREVTQDLWSTVKRFKPVNKNPQPKNNVIRENIEKEVPKEVVEVIPEVSIPEEPILPIEEKFQFPSQTEQEVLENQDTTEISNIIDEPNLEELSQTIDVPDFRKVKIEEVVEPADFVPVDEIIETLPEEIIPEVEIPKQLVFVYNEDIKDSNDYIKQTNLENQNNLNKVKKNSEPINSLTPNSPTFEDESNIEETQETNSPLTNRISDFKNNARVQQIKAKLVVLSSHVIPAIKSIYAKVLPALISVKVLVKSKLDRNYKNTNRKSVNNSSRNTQTNVKGIKKKRYIAGGVTVILIMLLFSWYLYAFAPNLKIYAEASNKPIALKQDITANFDGTGGIKAFQKTITQSSSDSIPTTGTGKVGTAASGSVRAYYLQATGSLLIKAGSILTCSNIVDCGGKALQFKTTQEVNITLASSPINLNLVAADIGGEYNLPSSIKFKLNGVAETDISLTNIAPFSGGASKDTKIVAQKDLDDEKKKLQDTLTSTAEAKILAEAGDNSEILKDKIKIEVAKFTSDKPVNAEAESINVNMDVNVTAVGYDKTTVRPYVESLLKQQEKDNLSLDFKSINIEQKIKESNDKSIVITLTVNAILRPNIDKDKIVSDLLGKNLSDIKPNIGKIPNIKTINYVYQPDFSPDFLKHIPNSKGSITVEIKEVNGN